MKLHLLSVGHKMPAWVEQAYREYAQRLPAEAELVLKEISPGKRGKNADIRRIMQDEGQRILAAIPKNNHVVALDVKGKAWSTEQLAKKMEQWMLSGQDVSLLVGGADGLSPACHDHADEFWSLSTLTFPHPLVRVILAEQLYRAWSVLRNHPYHRA